MTKVGGNERLDSLACPLRTEPATPFLTITDAGVMPKELTIDRGQRIVVVNASAGRHQVASNPHPIHTDCPPLNEPGFLPSGESGTTRVFEIAGTCGFHDHLDPRDATMQGRIHIREPS